MAEQTGKPQEGKPAEEQGSTPKRSGRSVATLGLIGGVMLVEGLAIFLCARFFGSEPSPLEGAVPTVPATKPADEHKEIEVTELQVPNTMGPRTTLYSLRFVIVVHHSNASAVAEMVKSKKWTIDDTLSRVVREADPRELMEPGLETLRRKAKFELDRIFEGSEAKDAIEHVLIPACLPVRSGF